jgi:DNA-binding transcriptional ArsR family regulator
MEIKDILAIDNRKKIYKLIKDYPCIHLSEIFRKIDQPEATIRYHLDYLTSHKLICKVKENGYTRYHIKEELSKEKRDVLSFINNPVCRNLILFLCIKIAASQKQISKALEKDASTVSFHLKKLKEKEIIEPIEIKNDRLLLEKKNITYMKCKTKGRKKMYKLKNPPLIYELLISNEKIFSDDDITKALLRWFEFCFINKKYTVFHDTSKDEIDIIEEILFDIFPHPYHA